MRNFFQFILKHHFGLLFIILELFAFILIINFNQKQKAIFLSSSSNITGSLFSGVSDIEQYFSLAKVNKELSNENAYLRSQLASSGNYHQNFFATIDDSVITSQYKYISCKVINNSIRRNFNYITLDKGKKDGIKEDMGVISGKGVVGVIIKCSKNYSTALSVLNPRLKISAKLKNSNFFGSITWNNKSPQHVILDEIPEHAKVDTGVVVVTSGYSAIFPEGITIGTIEEVKHPPGESFYKIKVKLNVDFTSLSYVEAIDNIYQKQQLKLEEESK